MLINISLLSDREILMDCRLNSIRALLNYYGVSINTYWLLLLCESFTFQYGKISFPNYSIYRVPYAVASKDNIEYSLFDVLSIQYQINQNSNLNTIKQIVSNGTPILVKMDSRALDRNDKRLNEHLKMRYLSIPLLVGFNEMNNELMFYWEWISPIHRKDDNVFPIILSSEVFQKGRNTECFPFCPNNKYCFVEDASTIQNITKAVLSEEIFKSIINIAKTMLYGTRIETPTLHELECDEVIAGIPAMYAFLEDILQLKKCLENDNSEKNRKYTLFSLLLFRENISTGSLSAFREEFGTALVQFGKYTECNILILMGREMINISLLWKVLLRHISNLRRGKMDFQLALDSVVTDFLEIIRREKIVYTSLLEFL